MITGMSSTPNARTLSSGTWALKKPYYQVFSDRFGFTPGLSALDLLFNEGPDAVLWLKRLA